MLKNSQAFISAGNSPGTNYKKGLTGLRAVLDGYGKKFLSLQGVQ
jgi:hypothetical protein